MVNSASLDSALVPVPSPSSTSTTGSSGSVATAAGHELRLARFSALEALAVGGSAVVSGFEALEAELAEWLRAVGIAEGEQVTVLRRGAFGGPIHVRTGSGGEFALHRSLARSILVREPSR